MASKKGTLWEISTLILILTYLASSHALTFIEKQEPADCKTGSDDEIHEYYDISQLLCSPCSQPQTIQTVTDDGLRCKCRPGYILSKDFGGGDINCAACPANQVTSADGWQCVSCDSVTSPINAIESTCQPCESGLIAVERILDGSWGTDNTRTCESCTDFTSPNGAGDRCERCTQVLSVLPSRTACDCPQNQQSGGLCFSEISDLTSDNTDLYTVNFGDEEFTSAYMYQNVRAAHGMCQPKYGNLTACQLLGNMCSMIMYTRKNEGSGSKSDACSLYLQLRGDSEWKEDMPWLYYNENGDEVLKDNELTQTFSFPDTKLNFVLAKYAVNGTYLGSVRTTNGMIQLCKNSQDVLDAAYDFGTTYTQTCEIDVSTFFDESIYETVFYDMYMEFSKDGEDSLYAIPVLVLNNGDNDGSDRTKWEMVRRFFLVDNISGKEVKSTTSDNEAGQSTIQRTFENQARSVRFAKSMHIHIELLEGSTQGLISPPYLAIEYSTASAADKDDNKQVTVTFDVSYSMSLDKYRRDLSIAVGVLSAFAIVYGGVLTWGWSKRAGKIAIDFQSLLKFVLFTIGVLANVFFVVAFGSAAWWLVFYKRQSNVYLIVPKKDEEQEFVAYLSTAFALKTIQLIHMIFVQCRVDIFFLDWERPKGKAASGAGEAPVSIWRTYFAANEWNEIQTTRKINQIFQIFCVVLFLYFVGFENFATMNPLSNFTYDDNTYKPPMSRTFRFAVGGLVYLVTAVAQWVFHTFIYERFIEDKVRQYTDLLSMANISIFVLENDLFGYYIHGRSVHGRADTDMRQMHEDFKREEESLCGTRGLQPNTEKQTFEMAIPRRLREQYNRVMLPIATRQQGAQAMRGQAGGGDRGSHIDSHTERCIQAYGVLNRLLQSFIDHSTRDIDYTIEDKLLFESILNVEFKDSSEKGFFYNDSGHSFDRILFFGNETTLTIFELLFFSIVDLIAQDFVLAGIFTYILGQIVLMIRDGLGRRNLASKTLVDERFLI